MANLDRPRGAECVGVPLRASRYIASGVVCPGELVALGSDGKVAAAAASAALLGAALSYASGDGVEVLVADHPDQRFVIQADDATIDAQTDINLNYDIVATAEDSTYKIARMELDASTQATTATLPLKLLGIDRSPKNALGANVDCIVKINNHQLAASTGTAGV